MHLMAEGGTAEAIGTALGVSVETVRTHVRNVIRKLQARNRVHAIALALERGEIALDAPPRSAVSMADDELRALVHDLRTPLTLVEGFSDLLVRRADDLPAAERDEYVRRIADAAREMRELLDRRRALERRRPSPARGCAWRLSTSAAVTFRAPLGERDEHLRGGQPDAARARAHALGQRAAQRALRGAGAQAQAPGAGRDRDLDRVRAHLAPGRDGDDASPPACPWHGARGRAAAMLQLDLAGLGVPPTPARSTATGAVGAEATIAEPSSLVAVDDHAQGRAAVGGGGQVAGPDRARDGRPVAADGALPLERVAGRVVEPRARRWRSSADPGCAGPVTVGSAVLTGGEGTIASPHAMPSWVHDPMNALL